MNPTVTVARKNNSAKVMEAVARLGKKQVYVGIPAADARSRAGHLLKLAAATPAIVAKANLMRAAKSTPTNAELLFIHSKGSPVRGIPARPVIEPAILAQGNKEAIAAELAGAAKAALAGDEAGAGQKMKRAGIAGQRAAQGWFTDPRNHWAPLAPSTVAAKGSDVPLIDTGALRQAITYVVKDK